MKRFLVEDIPHRNIKGISTFWGTSDHVAQKLPSGSESFLQFMREFRTADEHLHIIRSQLRLSPAEAEPVERLIHLVSQSPLAFYCEDFGTHSAHNQAARSISSMAIPTYQRPQQLLRCLESYAANFKHFNRNVRFVISDDCPESDSSNSAHATVEKFAKDTKSKVFYVDPHSRRRLLTDIQRESQVDDHILEFAMFGDPRFKRTTGSNRNVIHLVNAGDLFLSVDDDTICSLATKTEMNERVVFDSADRFPIIDFFDSTSQTNQAVPRTNADFAGLHESILGLKLNQITSSPHQARVVTGSIDSPTIQNIRKGVGDIVISQMGHFGDIGSDEGVHHIFRSMETFPAMQTEVGFKAAWESRQIWKMPQKLAISRRLGLQSMCLGYDGSKDLPPFFPNFRAQDGILFDFIRKCFGSHYIGYLPWAIQHSPPNSRTQTATSLRFNFAEIMKTCLGACTFRYPEPGLNRMRRLGQALEDMDTLPTADFRDFVVTDLRTTLITRAEGIEKLLSRKNQISSLQVKLILQQQEVIENTLLNLEAWMPNELSSSGSQVEAMRVSQQLVGSFGRLLVAWPEICRAAASLKTRGLSIFDRWHDS